MSAVIPIDHSKVSVSAIGAKFDQSLDRGEWKALWPVLRGWAGSLNWLIGDWINFGKARWGEKYALALELTDFEYQMLRDCAWVASKVHLSYRYDKLSHTHHREVAPLRKRDQRRFLKAAAEQGWTVSQLRRAIREDAKEVVERPRTPPFMPRAWVELGMRYFLRQEVESWPEERRQALKAELDPIVELHRRL